MILDLNISVDDFENFIDFSEAILFFDSSFESMKSFKAWGMTILKEANCISSLEPYYQLVGKDLYVSGQSKVEFGEIHRGEISVALYKGKGEGFIKDINNEIVRISNHWGNKSQSNPQSKEYQFQCVTHWPFGYCDLKIIGNHEIQISIETDNIIDAQSYILDPEKYGSFRQ